VSATSTAVTDEHFQYLAARTRGDDPLLVQLKEAARSQGIPAIWISPEQASLMQILLRLRSAARVLEVGTLAGYSALCMARALPPHGEVHTIELEPKHAAFARSWIARSEVADRIVVHEGRGIDVLATFPDQSFDACFLDADKSSYKDYLAEAYRLLREDGLIMVDNAFAFGQLFHSQPSDPGVQHIRDFNDHMAQQQGFHSCIVAVGDGLWVGVKGFAE
jgi:caffeoyl-CoA O-methyltransferase